MDQITNPQSVATGQVTFRSEEGTMIDNTKMTDPVATGTTMNCFRCGLPIEGQVLRCPSTCMCRGKEGKICRGDELVGWIDGDKAHHCSDKGNGLVGCVDALKQRNAELAAALEAEVVCVPCNGTGIMHSELTSRGVPKYGSGICIVCNGAKRYYRTEAAKAALGGEGR